MRIGAIVLCRASSRRLPGKVLMPLEGKPVLLHIIERLGMVNGLDEIIIATSGEPSDDGIADFAKAQECRLYRGDLDNVAKRFLSCAQENELDYAIRINGDNVFVDCQLVEQMIAITRRGQKDFITNVPGRTFPFGMSVEIVSVSFFAHIFAGLAESADYREHVTLFLYDNESKFASRFHYQKNSELPEAQGIKLALDTQEDLELVTFIMKKLGKLRSTYTLKDVVSQYYEYLER